MKTTKILSFLLAAVMIFSLAACGAPASPAPAESATPAEETPVEEPVIPAEVVPATDADAQISLIFANLGNMKQPDVGNEWKYMVTDLDHNGRMELIAASTHPADRSTNFKVWEVSEDRTALNDCTVQLEAEESFPDILTENADTFHNIETDTWSYLFFDHIVISPEEAYTAKCAVTLKDGVIGYEPFAYEHTEVTGGVTKVTHLDLNGLTIAPEQYNAAGVNAFVGCEQSSTDFGWFTQKSDATLSDLVESYYYFTGINHHQNVMPAPTPTPTTAPTATPKPSPTPTPAPTYLIITKNPTNENRKVGETAYFVANANAFTSLTWTFVAPNGGEYSPGYFAVLFPKAKVTGESSTTIAVSNVVGDMNGWGAYCTFYYNGMTARSNTAYILVKKPAPTPAPVTPTPTPVAQNMNGVVIDYLMSTVTIKLDNMDTVQILKDICEVDGSLGIGCKATVWYTGSKPTLDTVTYVFIYGNKEPEPAPEPEPVYASMAGNVHNITAPKYSISLANGQTVEVDASLCQVMYGEIAEGCGCTVYYIDYPTAENIYQVDVYGVTKGLIIPDEPEPTTEPEATTEPEQEKKEEPSPEPVLEPEPEKREEPAPEPEVPAKVDFALTGTYSDGRTTMKVSGSSGRYTIEVHGSNGANESVDWVFHGDFDNNGLLRYTDGVKTITTTDAAGNATTTKTENISGTLQYSAAGETMKWSETDKTYDRQ